MGSIRIALRWQADEHEERPAGDSFVYPIGSKDIKRIGAANPCSTTSIADNVTSLRSTSGRSRGQYDSAAEHGNKLL